MNILIPFLKHAESPLRISLNAASIFLRYVVSNQPRHSLAARPARYRFLILYLPSILILVSCPPLPNLIIIILLLLSLLLPIISQFLKTKTFHSHNLFTLLTTLSLTFTLYNSIIYLTHSLITDSDYTININNNGTIKWSNETTGLEILRRVAIFLRCVRVEIFFREGGHFKSFFIPRPTTERKNNSLTHRTLKRTLLTLSLYLLLLTLTTSILSYSNNILNSLLVKGLNAFNGDVGGDVIVIYDEGQIPESVVYDLVLFNDYFDSSTTLNHFGRLNTYTIKISQTYVILKSDYIINTTLTSIIYITFISVLSFISFKLFLTPLLKYVVEPLGEVDVVLKELDNWPGEVLEKRVERTGLEVRNDRLVELALVEMRVIPFRYSATTT